MPSAGIMQGAPPAPEDQVTLANWRRRPWSAWSFHHVRELVPSALVPAGSPATLARDERDVLGIAFEAPEGAETTVRAALDTTATDGLVVLQGGRIVAEHYPGLYDGRLPHILFSVSKSITALVAGVLADREILNPDAPVTALVPEAAGSAYEDASIRHVLDMTVSADFSEDYLDAEGDYIRYRRAMLWDPPALPGQSPGDLRTFLAGMRRGAEPHGQAFDYVSPHSDMLGWLVERASGRRFPDLLSDLLWQPLGAERDAEITVDRLGAPRTAGGISAGLRDLARLGEMIRQRGRAGESQVVPAAWIDDMLTGGNPESWARGEMGAMFPAGAYRSKWYRFRTDPPRLAAWGIHGQFLVIDWASGAVVAKVSSQAEPSSATDDALNLALFAAIFEALTPPQL